MIGIWHNHDTDFSNVWECDLTGFYECAVEAISPNAPLPIYKEVDLFMFLDSDHTGKQAE